MSCSFLALYKRLASRRQKSTANGDKNFLGSLKSLLAQSRKGTCQYNSEIIRLAILLHKHEDGEFKAQRKGLKLAEKLIKTKFEDERNKSSDDTKIEEISKGAKAFEMLRAFFTHFTPSDDVLFLSYVWHVLMSDTNETSETEKSEEEKRDLLIYTIEKTPQPLKDDLLSMCIDSSPFETLKSFGLELKFFNRTDLQQFQRREPFYSVLFEYKKIDAAIWAEKSMKAVIKWAKEGLEQEKESKHTHMNVKISQLNKFTTNLTNSMVFLSNNNLPVDELKSLHSDLLSLKSHYQSHENLELRGPLEKFESQLELKENELKKKLKKKVFERRLPFLPVVYDLAWDHIKF